MVRTVQYSFHTLLVQYGLIRQTDFNFSVKYEKDTQVKGEYMSTECVSQNQSISSREEETLFPHAVVPKIIRVMVELHHFMKYHK